MSRSRKSVATTKSDSSEKWWRRLSSKRVRMTTRVRLLKGVWDWFFHPRELTNPYTSPKDDYQIFFDDTHQEWRRK
jgi:hypothetical protein